MAVLKRDSVIYCDYESLEKNCQVERENAFEIFNTKVIEYEEFTDYIFYDYTIMKKKKGIIKPNSQYDKLPKQINDVEKNERSYDYELSNDEIKQIMEKINKKSESAKMVETDSRKIAKNNLLKSSKLLYQYAEANANEFKSFITLTFEDNIQDVTKANKKFDIWRTNFKSECAKHGIEFKYLGVPEFQKRGAVHYHILTNVPCDCEMLPKKPLKKLYKKKENKWVELEYYDLKYWRYGFSSAFDLTKTDENFNVVKYIAKYFFKDMDDRMYYHKKILKSNNLKAPKIEHINRNVENIFNEDFILENNIDSYVDIIKQDEIIKVNKYNNMQIIRVWNHF